MAYTFSEELVSDLHKDAYGHRPSFGWWDSWNNSSDAYKQRVWNGLLLALDDTMERERLQKIVDLAEFEREIAITIAAGAADRVTALRWMTQNALFQHEQDVEHWVWERGILFTDEGRALVKELMEIVEFAEWKVA